MSCEDFFGQQLLILSELNWKNVDKRRVFRYVSEVQGKINSL
jgi:hypothetical protein